MKSRYTALKARLFVFSPVSFVLFIVALIVAAASKDLALKLVGAGIAVMAVEAMAAMIKMDVAMMVRRYARGMVSIFIRNAITSAPTRWHRKRFPQGAVLLFLALGASSNDSFADYTVTDSMRYDREWRAGTIGMGREDVVEVLCNRCDLKLALKNLLPDDFTVYVAPDFNVPAGISYSGGKPWGSILQRVAEENDLRIEIMRHKQRVVVDPAPQNKGSVSVVSLFPKSDGFYATKTFELIPGDTLKTSFTRWAASEGWDVIYQLENDLTIENHAAFSGNLIQAMQAALQAYKASGKLARVQLDYSHANDVVRISLDSKGK